MNTETLNNKTEEIEVTRNPENELIKLKIRNIVTSVYDIQKVRISVGNRIVASFNQQLGQKPSTSQENIEDEENLQLIKALRSEFKRLTDIYIEEKVSIKKAIKSNEKNLEFIRTPLDYELIHNYEYLINSEEGMIKQLSKELVNHPIYNEFLLKVKGCGPLMSGVIISYFDPYVARHVSSFLKYAGIDPVAVEKENGEIVYEGRSKKHLEDYEYIDKEGNIQTKKGITFNPFVKTKLLGVLCDSFIKCKSPYSDAYYDYKHRLENRPDCAEYSKLRIHRMCKRYMLKCFLRDLWVKWREIEGLYITEPYEVAFLNRKPHRWNDFHEKHATEPVTMLKNDWNFDDN